MAETVEELKQEMVDRYNNLSNDEKDIMYCFAMLEPFFPG